VRVVRQWQSWQVSPEAANGDSDTMIIVAYTFECADCRPRFAAPESEGYGSFILRSSGRGTAVAMDGLKDVVYREVDDLLRVTGAYGNGTDIQRAELLQAVFGVACDKDEDGTEFRIGSMPRCPKCGSRRMASWEPTRFPYDYRDSVPLVTHNDWTNLSIHQRKRCYARAC
jgi:hypothetical protein